MPHDWSSAGPFRAEYGSGNGYAPGGIGWYRKYFRLDRNQSRAVAIEFDGVYDWSEIWVNGQFVGGRPYGFSSFQFDVTPSSNLALATMSSPCVSIHSRFRRLAFYTGSGIYRNVRLVITDKLRIAHWGAWVTTPKIKSDSAVVRIETTIENGSPTKGNSRCNELRTGRRNRGEPDHGKITRRAIRPKRWCRK